MQLLLLLTERLRSATSQVSVGDLDGKNTVRLACLVEQHRLLLFFSEVPTRGEVNAERVPEARKAMEACKDRKEVADALREAASSLIVSEGHKLPRLWDPFSYEVCLHRHEEERIKKSPRDAAFQMRRGCSAHFSGVTHQLGVTQPFP